MEERALLLTTMVASHAATVSLVVALHATTPSLCSATMVSTSSMAATEKTAPPNQTISRTVPSFASSSCTSVTVVTLHNPALSTAVPPSVASRGTTLSWVTAVVTAPSTIQESVSIAAPIPSRVSLTASSSIPVTAPPILATVPTCLAIVGLFSKASLNKAAVPFNLATAPWGSLLPHPNSIISPLSSYVPRLSASLLDFARLSQGGLPPSNTSLCRTQTPTSSKKTHKSEYVYQTMHRLFRMSHINSVIPTSLEGVCSTIHFSSI